MAAEAHPRPLYHSPIGLYDFQAEHTARAYLMEEGALVTWETGLGKTHLAMALSALLFEDDLIDHVIVCAEKSMVNEWMSNFERFTDLEAVKYHGISPKKRAEIRASLPQVIVSTYETVKIDAVRFKKGNKRKDPDPGPLAETLRGSRVLFVYDEATKVKERTSGNHRGHHALVQKMLRPHGEVRIVALTATPIERGPENIYNIVRIIDPALAGPVSQFEGRYVKDRDIYGRATYKNLSKETLVDPVISLEEQLAPIMLRKRKTDPDVVDQFPDQVEEFWSFPLEGAHANFYDAVLDAFAGEDDSLDAQLFGILRQIAAHPLSLVRSEGALAKAIMDEVGEPGLRAIGSTKSERLRELLDRLVRGQGDQALIFSFYGPSVLPVLERELYEDGYRVGMYHGQITQSKRERSKQDFQDGKIDILLSSDAGSRGLNFPNAAYVIQYELPFTHSLYLQRGNRNHRIDSNRSFVLNFGMIAQDTIEDGIIDMCWNRHQMSDEVLGDVHAEGAITAEIRRSLLQRERERRGG